MLALVYLCLCICFAFLISVALSSQCSPWLEKHRRCGRVWKEVHLRSPLRPPWVLSLLRSLDGFSRGTPKLALTPPLKKKQKLPDGFYSPRRRSNWDWQGRRIDYGKKFEEEIKPELKHTGAGILSMENAGPDTNGSQFFISLAPCPSLDGKHTIFGRVCRGMEIIKRLGSIQTDNNDRPIHDVKVLRTTVKD